MDRFRRTTARVRAALAWRGRAFRATQDPRVLLRPPVSGQRRFAWSREFYSSPVRPELALYESFGGRGALCNPDAIFRELLGAPDQSHRKHVVSLATSQLREAFDAEYAEYSNVRSVLTDSDDYWRTLSTAGLLVNNATFPASFTKREGQTYVNTWHGTPLKRMGYDSTDGPLGTRNILRNLVAADYLVSPNPFTTDRLFGDAFRLRGIFAGRVLEEGYPRIDAQFATASEIEATRRELDAHGLAVGQKRIVLYAPTWKGETEQSPLDEATDIVERLSRWEAADPLGRRYLVRVHQSVQEQVGQVPELARYLIPATQPANVTLAVTDVLVTDYSSIFFDFLASDRPIAFFVPDRDEYDDLRGLYAIDRPGPEARTNEDMIAVLAAIGAGGEDDAGSGFSAERARLREEFCGREDGSATQRVVDVVLRGAAPTDAAASRRLGPEGSGGRERILLRLGSMRPGGATTAALNLVAALDFDRFDVSVLAPMPGHDTAAVTHARIDPRARQFYVFGSPPLTVALNRRLQSFRRVGAPEFGGTTSALSAVFATEYARLFGATHFDRVIDLGADDAFEAQVLCVGPRPVSGSIRAVWLHVDLVQHPRQAPLLNAYRSFDRVLSSTAELTLANRAALAPGAGGSSAPDAFRTAPIPIRPGLERDATNARWAERNVAVPEAWHRDGTASVGALLDALLATDAAERIAGELYRRERLRTVFPGGGGHTLVSVGRMTPRKHQDAIIEAFATVREGDPAARLVIVGAGPRLVALRDLVRRLDLEDAVIFTGRLDPVDDIIVRARGVVLATEDDGVPIVLLEALALGRPIVAAHLGPAAREIAGASADFVGDGPSELAAGMRALLAGPPEPSSPWDARSYSTAAMRCFLSATSAEG